LTATDKASLTATQAITINIGDAPEKVEFRKGTVTSDLVTLEVWVDPGTSFASADLQLTFAQPTKFVIDVNAVTSPLTFAQSGWTALASEAAPGSYLIGGYNSADVADTPAFQKLLSIAVQRNQPTTDAIQFTMDVGGIGDYLTNQPTDYIFSLV
jgi:hypothetical protein